MSAEEQTGATAAAAAPAVPTAVEVVTEEKPAGYNPEALEDVARPPPEDPSRFQNVDLEAGTTTEAAAPPANNTSSHEKSILAEVADSLDWGAANIALTASYLVVLIASGTICDGTAAVFGTGVPGGVSCTGKRGFQVAFGTIGTFFGLVTVALYFLGKLTDARAQEIISVFQFLWAVAGMIVLTFFGDFQTLLYANGYFGTWLALLFSALALTKVSKLFENTVTNAVSSTRTPLLILIIASAVVMGASIAPCSPSAACTSYNAFAVALGVIPLAISIILIFIINQMPAKLLKGICVVMFIWWAVGFCVVSFGGPFIAAGNGYFASLAAVMASFSLMSTALRQGE